MMFLFFLSLIKPSGNDLENHQAFQPVLGLRISVLALLMMVIHWGMALRVKGLARLRVLGRRVRQPLSLFFFHILFAPLVWGFVVIRLQRSFLSCAGMTYIRIEADTQLDPCSM